MNLVARTLVPIGLVAALFTTPVVHAETDLAAATTALENGDATAAIAGYEAAAGEGLINGHLFYNLGIAYQRAGRTGDAMAAFLAARRYLPRDPDVAANLRFVLTTTKDKLEPETQRSMTAPLQAVVSKFTTRELMLATGVLFALAGLAFLATVLVPSWSGARRAVLFSLAAPILVAALLSLKMTQDEVWGATFSKTPVKAYSGPASSSTVVFELQEGAPVLIRERGNAGYLRVQLSDGKSGWIAGSEVRVFGAPFGAL